MKSPPLEVEESLQALLADGIRRAQHDAAAAACASDDLARAVTAGAVAGAMAGAVAGASAAAATVQAARQFADSRASLDRGVLGIRDGGAALASPMTPANAVSSQLARSPPAFASPSGGEWARAFDTGTKAYYYYDTRTLETTWTPPAGWEAYLESGGTQDLAHATLGERSAGGATPQRAEATSSGSPPSLYARDTDIDTQEEVDPRVGDALEEMNNAMCRVNDLEASIVQAKRKVRVVEAEQKQKCQTAFDKLSRGVKEALPVCRRQILIRQQVEKTRLAFVEYQRAHDAHTEAKAAVAAVENQLIASSGGSIVDTDLLSQSSDLASRVIETETHKLKADRIHAAEARRLSELSAEAQSAPRVSKDHTERALQYMEFKARAEAALLAEMELVKTLERQLREAKQAYAHAMSSLDDISKEIHMKRAQSAASLAVVEEHAAAAAPGPHEAAAVEAAEGKI